jgi:ribosomal protein S6--L-glutamate ligase
MAGDCNYMRLISFDTLRTLDIPGVKSLKPEEWFRAKEDVKAADWILFPEYWQVNPLVYAWKKRIFPSVSSFHLGHDKVEMTRAFESVCQAHVPLTRIMPAAEYAEQRILDEFSFPLVAKEVRNSMGRGVHLIHNRRELRQYIASNPVLYVQEYLPITRDLRVVVVGNRAVATYWRQAADGRFHNNVAQGATVSFDGVPDAAVSLVEGVANELGIDHAGFDVAEVDGWFYLFEFNVRFGTQALHSRGIRVGPLILRVLRDRTPSHPVQPDTPLLSHAQ